MEGSVQEVGHRGMGCHKSQRRKGFVGEQESNSLEKATVRMGVHFFVVSGI